MQKFSELPYQTPDYESVLPKIDQIAQRLQNAQSADEQITAMKEMDLLVEELYTTVNIGAIRSTIDSRDAFYQEQRAYNEKMDPLVAEKLEAYRKALAFSRFRPELEQRFGSLMFRNIDLALKCFSPKLIPLMQAESLLVQRYDSLLASARIEFDGKICNLSKMGPYMESVDRNTRKAAMQAFGNFFDEHQAEFDDLFDQLVKNRDQQAHLLGLNNYVELAFMQRGRNCYSPEDVAQFRRQVVEELVPVTVKIKREQAERMGLTAETFQYYDNPLSFPDGNPTPQGTPDELMAAGRRMYNEISPETAEFIELMFEGELFDVLTKEGKENGGYCQMLSAYHCPFIFANWNGTAGDVDVLTHEAGHAFAFYMADKLIDTPALRHGSMEVAESHSMSMEFLTAPWHHLFFRDQTDKYEVHHANSALAFIPYGCEVDHFQESIYLHPEWTPAQRNEEWARLEKLYRPYLNRDEINFHKRGAGWQRQSHIYQTPFYYIDYSLAQTISLQFWVAAMHDQKQAWEKYVNFVRQGGTKTFVELVHDAGFKAPFEPGFLHGMIADVKGWLDNHQLA